MTFPKKIPLFATDNDYPGGVNPWNGTPNKVEPVTLVETQGFTPNTTLPAQYMNYLMNGMTRYADLVAKLPVSNWVTNGPMLAGDNTYYVVYDPALQLYRKMVYLVLTDGGGFHTEYSVDGNNWSLTTNAQMGFSMNTSVAVGTNGAGVFLFAGTVGSNPLNIWREAAFQTFTHPSSGVAGTDANTTPDPNCVHVLWDAGNSAFLLIYRFHDSAGASGLDWVGISSSTGTAGASWTAATLTGVSKHDSSTGPLFSGYTFAATNGSGLTVVADQVSEQVWHSTNALTWSKVTTTGTDGCFGLCWSDTYQLFYLLDGHKKIWTSSDGVAWSTSVSAIPGMTSSGPALIAGNGCLVATEGTDFAKVLVYCSVDGGTTWFPRVAGWSNANGIYCAGGSFANGRFWLGSNGSAHSAMGVMFSSLQMEPTGP